MARASLPAGRPPAATLAVPVVAAAAAPCLLLALLALDDGVGLAVATHFCWFWFGLLVWVGCCVRGCLWLFVRLCAGCVSDAIG